MIIYDTHATYRRFGALLKTFAQLAEIILHTIRIDIRCRSIHYLDAAMRLVCA